MVLLQAATPWSPAQVQDTVNRIVARPAYQRDFAESIFDRLLRAIVEFLSRLIEGAAGLVGTRAVVYTVLGALLLLLVIRLALDLRAEMASGVVTGRRGGPVQASDPWGEAERLARAGAYTDAAHALFRSLLTALGARGEVRVHTSKTAGEYARELRRERAPSSDRFQAFRVRYDRAIYGERTVSEAEYRALLVDARPMVVPERGR